uniref:ATP-dependent Clp protease ATP-binding subunit ClpX n=1 Tax=Globodera pallida TaxID=36090 RepID=A0A183BT07_GLOPA
MYAIRKQEHGELAVFTTPSVKYLADIVDNESIRKRRHKDNSQISICKPSDYPEVPTDVQRFLEPMSLVSIVTPAEFYSNIEKLCRSARGEPLETAYIDEKQMILRWRLPLVEIIVDFFDSLKLATSGYASFEQKDDGYRECRLEKICIFVNDKPVDELSMLCPGVNAKARAEEIVKKLAEEIPQQQFEVVVKAALGKSTKAVAHRKIKPMKKDFTGLLKGNLVADRLGKKLKHQREGKAKLKMVGVVAHLFFMDNPPELQSPIFSAIRCSSIVTVFFRGWPSSIEMGSQTEPVFFHEILRSVLPGRPHLLVLDDLFLFHPSLRPSKLLQFLLGLLARLPDRSFFLVATGDASRLSAYAATFFHLHIRLTPIGDGLSKNITGQMEIFRRDLQRHSLPLRTLLHYHCGQRSAKTFVPGSKQLLI